MEKRILIGYAHPSIKRFVRPPKKVIRYILIGSAYVSLAVALIPNGLGIIFYPLSFTLLGWAGINTTKKIKQLKNKVRLEVWKVRTRKRYE